jgi:ectoine hydroxylase-related dioxygenase (phytanoyl-CoA dioxygenase family)
VEPTTAHHAEQGQTASGSGSNSASAQTLTDAERESYAADGFFVRKAVFSEPEIDALRAAVEEIVARADEASAAGENYHIDGNRYVEIPNQTVQYEHHEGARTIRVIEPFHHMHEVFERLVDDLRIVAPMRGVIGCDEVALWTDKVNLKRPGEGSAFRWHQDSPYWTHACDHVDLLPNVMVTLDNASEANGCFRVIRGSHTKGCLPGTDDGTKLGPLFTDPAYIDDSEQVLAEAPAGSLVFFSPHTVHGSQPNHSSKPRRAMVLTYQPGGHEMFKLEGVRTAG